MKELIAFLSIYLKVCLCWHFSQQDNEFNYEVNITKNPWMVMIVFNEHEIVSYGALFHEKAVVTTAAISNNDIFQMQVFAECHTLSSQKEIDHKMCKNVRNIIEYNTLENGPGGSNNYNFMVLILSSSFELTPTLNVIHFARQNSVQLHNCIVLYPTLVTNPKTNQTGTLFYPSLNIGWIDVWVKLTSSFEDVKPQEKVRILPGSPVLCKSKTKPDEWYAIAIMTRIVRANDPSIGSRSIPLDFDKEVDVFTEILRKFKTPGDQSEVVIYYE